MVVIQEVLPTKLALGAVFGPDWNNKVLRAASGKVDTNQAWPFPLWHGTLSYEHLIPDDTLKSLVDFHVTKGGNALGWLFFNRRRFKVTGAKIGTANGAHNDFQLVDIYASPGGTPLSVPITRPIYGALTVQDHGTLRSNTVHVYVGGVEVIGGWTVLSTPGSMGKVHFAVAPAGPGDVTATCEYVFPCMFTVSHLPLTYDGIDVSASGLEFEQIPEN